MSTTSGYPLPIDVSRRDLFDLQARIQESQQYFKLPAVLELLAALEAERIRKARKQAGKSDDDQDMQELYRFMDVIQHKQKELSAINQYASLVTMQKATLEAGLWQKLDMNYTPNPLLASSSKTNLSPLSPLSPANHAVTPSQQLKGHPIGSYPPLLAETTEGIVVGTHHGLTTPMFLDSWPQGDEYVSISFFTSPCLPSFCFASFCFASFCFGPFPRSPCPLSPFRLALSLKRWGL
ncbi:hypothetical protein EW026_g5708 [Hermanssonia centrifuga]|uniref:Uncharacterized protein n=1 Tax=Hermanssonia centrifuga TaxID=98765 RepID=A0A4S4KD87_9APHY|nr:hypothetical protein EW026_g5708 [Hermanssonia centrifuga]